MRIKKIVYLDNAASSFPKPRSVISAVASFIKKNGANPGRSGHFLSEEAAATVYEARENAAAFFGVDSDSVIFTKNATEALNIAIFSAAKNGAKSFLTSSYEHNSVLRPLRRLAEDGATVGLLEEGKTADSVVVTAASNVTGNIADISAVKSFCKKSGALLITDVSQTAGYGVPFFGDIVCTAGHKALYGPQGTGLLVALTKRGKDSLLPLLYGGNGSDSLSLSPDILFPESFECGTLNTPAIVGLNAGINFVRKHGKDYLPREKKLQKLAITQLCLIGGVSVYTDPENSVPLVAFNVDGFPSERVTAFLSENGICVRGGYHCAPLMHKKLGTVPGGAVRISLGAFNCEKDIYRLTETIKKLKN